MFNFDKTASDMISKGQRFKHENLMSVSNVTSDAATSNYFHSMYCILRLIQSVCLEISFQSTTNWKRFHNLIRHHVISSIANVTKGLL